MESENFISRFEISMTTLMWFGWTVVAACGRSFVIKEPFTTVNNRVENYLGGFMSDRHFRYSADSGRVGYLVLWLLGAPIGLLLLLWVILGNNLIAPG